MKKILLIIHEMTYTGAPVMTKNIASVLIKNNYKVEIWSYQHGPYIEEFLKLGTAVKIVPPSRLSEPEIRAELQQFDLVIANTSCTYEVIDLFWQYLPVIWIIHEAKSIKHIIGRNKRHYFTLKYAKNLYAVSEYARDFIKEQYHKKAKVIHNFVEDEYRGEASRYKDREKEDVIKFLSLGSILENKAFDTFIHAFTSLDKAYRDRCELHLAGAMPNYQSEFADSLINEMGRYDNLFYHGELTNREAVMKLIENSDVIVAVSKDEACSLVTLEGAMMGKPLIISRNVGANYIVDGSNGWIVETGNEEALGKIYKQIIDDPSLLADMGLSSRQKYLKTSTDYLFEKNIIRIVKQQISIPKRLYKLSRWPYYLRKSFGNAKLDNPYPFTEVNKGSRIILYGAGEFGKSIHQQIKNNFFYKLVMWVDQKFPEYQKLGLRVSDPGKIKKAQYDYIFITVKNVLKSREIRAFLLESGVPEDKILWLPEYI